jgi:serine-type D-Ala-D-Ala carboxypeptidase (penicillin-binding protein 5/6)
MKKTALIILILMLTIATLFARQNTPIVYASTNEAIVPYSAKAYLLVDDNTGTTLAYNNENEKHQVASIVKLMTTFLTLEALEEGKINLEDKVLATAHSASMGGSQAFLDAGQEYVVSELLKSVIVASANDSSVLLGEIIAGSEASFVKLMNERARELGMKNTLYANATGLPDANQYSTAADTAIILKEVLKHKKYFDYSTIWMDDFYHPLDGRVTELANTNRLVRYYKGCDAGKTGYTDEAGFCLSASAQKGNMRLIAVTLGASKSKERFEIVSELLNYGFANYKNDHILQAGGELDKKVDIRGALNSEAKLTAKEDFYYIVKRGEEGDFEIRYELPKSKKAPLLKGETVGLAYVIKDGQVVGEVEVVAYEDNEKQTMKQVLKKIFAIWGIENN